MERGSRTEGAFLLHATDDGRDYRSLVITIPGTTWMLRPADENGITVNAGMRLMVTIRAAGVGSGSHTGALVHCKERPNFLGNRELA